MFKVFYACMVGFGVYSLWIWANLPSREIPGTAIMGHMLTLQMIAVAFCTVTAYQAIKRAG